MIDLVALHQRPFDDNCTAINRTTRILNP